MLPAGFKHNKLKNILYFRETSMHNSADLKWTYFSFIKKKKVKFIFTIIVLKSISISKNTEYFYALGYAAGTSIV